MRSGKLHIILTSYNRPFFLRRALDSILAQTDPRWLCWLMDDNSNDETKAVIDSYQYEPRFIIRYHDTAEAERKAHTRYSVLINSILDRLQGQGDIVGFMCDNVAYRPVLVEQVREYFDTGMGFAAYVPHKRDAWTIDGERLGNAEYFGHWNQTPPILANINEPAGLLDHSQVFHRLPCDVRWPEEIEYVKCGDAVYFTRLVERYGAIRPITDEVLTSEALFA